MAEKDAERKGERTQGAVLLLLLEKVGVECQVTFSINQRLVQECKTKIWRLRQAMEKARKKGGNGVKKLFSKWANELWDFKIYANKLDMLKLQRENHNLKMDNKRLENEIILKSTENIQGEKKVKKLAKKCKLKTRNSNMLLKN